MNLAWLKSHKLVVGGGVAGVLLLYYILKHSSPAASGPTDLSGGAGAVTNYDAAASLQNAQVNGQVEIAQVSAGVASQQVAAQVQMNRDTLAAELAATQQKTASDTAVALAGDAAAVQIQSIVSSADVAKTKIVGNTIVTLGAQHTSVQRQTLDIISQQIKQIQEHSKHASQDYGAIAPILAIETGQAEVAPGISEANAKKAVGQANAIAGGASSIFSSLMGGLFGKAA